MNDKVSLTMDPAIPARFEAMRVDAVVELADGSELTARCEAPRGAWGSARISHDEHLDKVRDCLSRRLSDAMVDRCVELAVEIDQLGAADVAELLAIAGGLT